MIKFSLRCDNDHSFDSWFRDGGSFDELSATAMLACPDCGSSRVSKALMAPAVMTSRKRMPPRAPEVEPPPPATQPTQPVAVADERAFALRSMLREMRDHLVKHSTDVGSAFAAEARRINDGASENTAIHGTASPSDVASLIEDGIGVMPLPAFPDELN